MPHLADPEYLNSLMYIDMPPSALGDADWRDVNRLVAASVQHDVPALSRREAAAFADGAQEKALRAEVLAEGGVEGVLQKHARARMILAKDDSRTVMALFTSDNASFPAKFGSTVAETIIDAKLHERLPLASYRWHYLGYRAVAPSLFPDAGTVHPEAFDLNDMGIYISMDGKDDKQPGSVWTWNVERWWEQTVKLAGYKAVGAPTVERPFGTDSGPVVHQQRRTIDSLGELRDNLRRKVHAHAILDAVLPEVMVVGKEVDPNT